MIITASIQRIRVMYMTEGEISEELEIIRLQVTEYIFQTHQLGQFYFKGNQISFSTDMPFWFKGI